MERETPRADSAAGTSRVVVGVDTSAGSAAALRWALREAELRSVPLTVLTAWAPTGPPHLVHHARVIARDELAVAEALERLIVRVVGDPTVPIDAVVARDEPTIALVKNSSPQDLVVVGARGYNQPNVRLSPICVDLVERSPSNVVIVRPEPTPAQPSPEPEPGARPVTVCLDRDERSASAALRWATDAAAARRVPLRVLSLDHGRRPALDEESRAAQLLVLGHQHQHSPFPRVSGGGPDYRHRIRDAHCTVALIRSADPPAVEAAPGWSAS